MQGVEQKTSQKVGAFKIVPLQRHIPTGIALPTGAGRNGGGGAGPGTLLISVRLEDSSLRFHLFDLMMLA